MLDELKWEVEFTKITDVFEIIDRGVDCTPALTIDGKLLFQGKVPTMEQIRKILREQITKEQRQ